MSIEVCIARSTERIGWTRFLRPFIKVTVYPTTDNGLDPGVHFSHIVNRYDSLADWTFFIQADPFDHEPRIVPIMNGWPFSMGQLTHLPEPGLCFLCPTEPMNVERSCWALGDGRGRAVSRELIALTVRERVEQVWRELYACEPPTEMIFSPGFHFAATRELLRTRSRAFYERLLALVQAREMGPWECERLLGSLWLSQYKDQARI
jgi:hypothetical protein